MAEKPEKLVTPVGELHYTNINGQGKENYNEDGYDFVSTIYLSGKEAEKIKTKIDACLGEIPKGKKLKSKGYRELKNDAEGNLYTPTDSTVEKDKTATDSGITAFAFKTGTTFPDGRPAKIAVYNVDTQKVNMGDRLIGNGSKGAISGKMKRGERGKDVFVSLYLTAIQLTEYIPYEGDAGFDEQEGEFKGPEDEETGFKGVTEDKVEKEEKSTKPRL